MIVQLPFPATLEDLMQVEGKAELVGGRIVELMATGDLPNSIAFEIAVSLRNWIRTQMMSARAYTDNAGFALAQPLMNGRESFSPDAALLMNPPTSNRMKFIPGPPTLAVEVRSENDYGPAAEIAIENKQSDYFEAGTQVVWDVDPLAETVTKHTADATMIFRRHEVADAEPAVPGWRVNVAELFDV